MKTRVNINITTGYHVLSSGSAVNLFLSRYLEKKKKQTKKNNNNNKIFKTAIENTELLELRLTDIHSSKIR